MTDEDIVAAKLKGYFCVIKFKDGEELPIKVPKIADGEITESEWFTRVEKFINDSVEEYFPLSGFSVSRESIKYVKKI